MPAKAPTLHMICGKIASGKSTLTQRLGREAHTVVISEDDWLKALFAEDMKTLRDFVRCSGKLRSAMAPHIVSLLRSGVSVVLDFQANTVDARAWMRGIFEEAEAPHLLHVLDTPDEVCLARLKARNAQGDHPFAVTEEEFARVSQHFQPPAPEEGFNVLIHQ
ncbi:MAG: ATP-binding protein [Pseudomonadota bacterium]